MLAVAIMLKQGLTILDRGLLFKLFQLLGLFLAMKSSPIDGLQVKMANFMAKISELIVLSKRVTSLTLQCLCLPLNR